MGRGGAGMKKLEDFRLVKEFLSAQGIEPTLGMVAVRDPEWADLVILAQQWKQEIEEVVAEKEARLAAMTPDEREQAQQEAEEEARAAQKEVLFHSCGSGRARK